MIKDKLTIQAKQSGFRARSIFKLIDINRKFNLIKKGDKILDLGCWPGSWLQFCSNLGCSCIGVDLKPINSLPNCFFIKSDIYDKKLISKIKKHGNFDAVLSDLAPNTTGIKEIDQNKSTTLSFRALEIVKDLLKERGNFLCKVFQSNETPQIIHEFKKYFPFVKLYKPLSSKKRSKEVYIIAKSKHNLNV